MTLRENNDPSALAWGTHALGLLVLLAGAAAFHQLVLAPLSRQTAEDLQASVRLRRLARASAGARAERDELAGAIAGLRERAEAVRRRIPDTPDEAVLLGKLTEIANAEGVELNDYRRGRVTETPTYSKLEVGLKATGVYASLCRLLDQTHALPRLVAIERMAIESAGDEAYPLDLTLALYFGLRPQSPEPGGGRP